MRLENKVALVTGSSQGIGRGIALRLAQEGADIILHGRDEDALAQETEQQIRAEGGRVCFIEADLSQVASCRRLVSEGVARMGRIDILINNAGAQKNAGFLDTSEQDYDLILNVNLRAAFFVAQTYVQHLVDRGEKKGCIINNSSVHEELPFPNFTSYCASKGGLKLMMRNLAIELAPLGIRVNNVAPGAIETPINAALMNQPEVLARLLENIPASRLGQPRDVAGAVAFLASADADYITGTTLYVDGGLLWNYSEQ
ncbi:SDR family NAD(P)-dependent oxidoreductase [Stutzerimonas tarimensis]|uniref:SDR family NAD(P)-dependent oxidoreductase n=1 Tax=Stutzerimonas tarimensis TaxID=1507735 RepID=A0ABV7T665_9GAMM